MPPVQSGTQTFHRELTQGVNDILVSFLDWWDIYGTFDITVVKPDGGLRTEDVQWGLYQRGASKAKNLAETAHGHAAALDLAPYRRIGGLLQPDWKDIAGFNIIGKAAEDFGLDWGGRWTSFKDLSHVEIPGWRSFPIVSR